MASITQILGTDSLSSSRIILNDNFTALNSELGDVTTLLNTTAQTLTLTGLVRGGSLTVNNGTDLFTVTGTDVTSNIETSIDANFNVKKGITYSVEGSTTAVTTLPTANSWEASTYVMASTSFTTNVVLSTAVEGRQITLIADGGDIVFDVANIAGESTPITLVDGKTLTLRYVGSFWYVISKN